jgi:hypothetical protein
MAPRRITRVNPMKLLSVNLRIYFRCIIAGLSLLAACPKHLASNKGDKSIFALSYGVTGNE